MKHNLSATLLAASLAAPPFCGAAVGDERHADVVAAYYPWVDGKDCSKFTSVRAHGCKANQGVADAQGNITYAQAQATFADDMNEATSRGIAAIAIQAKVPGKYEDWWIPTVIDPVLSKAASSAQKGQRTLKAGIQFDVVQWANYQLPRIPPPDPNKCWETQMGWTCGDGACHASRLGRDCSGKIWLENQPAASGNKKAFEQLGDDIAAFCTEYSGKPWAYKINGGFFMFIYGAWFLNGQNKYAAFSRARAKCSMFLAAHITGNKDAGVGDAQRAMMASSVFDIAGTFNVFEGKTTGSTYSFAYDQCDGCASGRTWLDQVAGEAYAVTGGKGLIWGVKPQYYKKQADGTFYLNGAYGAGDIPDYDPPPGTPPWRADLMAGYGVRGLLAPFRLGHFLWPFLIYFDGIEQIDEGGEILTTTSGAESQNTRGLVAKDIIAKEIQNAAEDGPLVDAQVAGWKKIPGVKVKPGTVCDNVQVMMKNTGDLVWSERNLVRLREWDRDGNGTDLAPTRFLDGGRAYLDGNSYHNGDVATFTFSIWIPPQGPYTLRLRLDQEAVGPAERWIGSYPKSVLEVPISVGDDADPVPNNGAPNCHPG